MYGIIISAAMLLAILFAQYVVHKENKDDQLLWGATFWALLAGIVGARIYHVIDFWDLYSENLWLIPQTWLGGMGIYGGLLAGSVTFAAYVRLKKQKVLEWLDIAGYALPLAQAVGRWGNYFNKELLPYSVYESAADALLFIALYFVWPHKRKLHSGSIFLIYALGYGMIRFLLEIFRQDSWSIAGINVAQAISVSAIASSLVALFIINRKHNKKIAETLCVFGIGLSLYLTYVKLSANPTACVFLECEKVSQSPYAQFLGIPVALLGVIYYLALFLLITKNLQKYMIGWLAWGIAFSTYLTYLELFVIKAVCGWCVVSFVNIVLISLCYTLLPTTPDLNLKTKLKNTLRKAGLKL